MSATISTDSFSEYFYSIHNNERFQAPVLQTRRDVNFPVKIYYLNNCTSIPEVSVLLHFSIYYYNYVIIIVSVFM